MTDITQQDRARLRAQKAHDKLLADLADMPLDKAQKATLRSGIESLYSACLLVLSMGDEPVILTMQTKLKEEP